MVTTKNCSKKLLVISSRHVSQNIFDTDSNETASYVCDVDLSCIPNKFSIAASKEIETDKNLRFLSSFTIFKTITSLFE